MAWLWIGGAGLLGFFVGVFLCERANRHTFRQSERQRLFEMDRLKAAQVEDRELFLRTLRRELANHIIRFDPDRYCDLYCKARDTDLAISRASKSDQQAQLDVITKKHPSYESFDLVGTCDHVLYPDALQTYSSKDIEQHYLSIIEFQALKRALDDDWKRALDVNWDLRSVTSDEELAHLKKYIRRIKDTRFRQRLVAAVDEFDAHRADDNNSWGRRSIAYETKVLAVSWVNRSPENGWGFHFKDTDEFGLYSFFLDDNNSMFQHFYRTDSKFEEEIYLDYLRIDDRL